MKVSNTQRQRLLDALLSAYTSSEQLRLMVRLEFDQNLEEIATGSNLRLVTFELIDWAERTDRLETLINGALAQNPSNPQLLAVAQDYRSWATLATTPSSKKTSSDGSNASSPLREVPFIGPVPFAADTAHLFFGRTSEIEQLIARLRTRSVPLLVVNGLSGSGKTSLLRAGLMPKLETLGIPVLYTSILDSPHSDLLHTIRMFRPDGEISSNADCIQALNAVFTYTSADALVLIVDQVERCFASTKAESEQVDFWRSVARIIRGDTTKPVKLVLAVRSDWLYALQAISPTPVDVALYNFLFFVEPLTRTQAREAFVEPLRAFHVDFDDDVVDTIIADLSASQEYVHPPQLQVVGAAIFEYLEANSGSTEARHLTLQVYKTLNGATSILRQHLLRILRSLGPRENVGWQILLRLVGDNDIRLSCREDEVRGNLAEDAFRQVIDSFVKYALVIRDISTADGSHVYTLTHDQLVSEVKLHFEHDGRLQALRTSEHYLTSGLNDYRSAAKHDPESFLPLEHERFLYISRHSDLLDYVSPEAAQYLCLSAIWHGDANFATWFVGLPSDDKPACACMIRQVCQHRLAKGEPSSFEALKDALTRDLPAEDKAVLKQTLLPVLLSDGSNDPCGSHSATLKADRGERQQVARALWSLRRDLPMRDRVRLVPPLSAYWLQQNMKPVITAVAAVVLLSAVALGIWIVRERLAGSWTETPPLYAGGIPAMAIDPDADLPIFVATASGREKGEGATVFAGDLGVGPWASLGQSLAAEGVQAMAVAQSQGTSRLYISVLGRGIYRWEPDTREWEQINRNLNSYDIKALVANPDDGLTLYAGAANYGGVYETSDGGDSWFDTSGDELFGLSVLSLAYSRADGGSIVAGTSDGRIFRKRLDDAHWTFVAAFAGVGSVLALASEPIQGEYLLAGTATGDILISVDAGQSWGYLSKLPNTFIAYSLAIAPNRPEEAYVSGYGVGGNIIWRSVDEAYTWEPVPDNTFSREFLRLAVDPVQPDTIYAYGGAGLFVSQDKGASWSWVNEVDAPIATVSELQISPVDGSPIYASVGGSVFASANLSSGDWTRCSNLPALIVRDIEPHLVYSQTAFAGIYIPNRWSIYVSHDAGRTWSATEKPTAIPERFLDDTRALASANNAAEYVIYAGTTSCGVLVSADQGITWDTYGRTDCHVLDGPTNVTALSAAPGRPNIIYAVADGDTIYRSEDYGKNWWRQQLDFTNNINGIEADPQVPGRLYLIAGADGFWRSDDNGVTWTKRSDGLQDRALISIAATSVAGKVYVAAVNGDIWSTSDGGDRWQSIRRNLTARSATSIAAYPDGEQLLLATNTVGIYHFEPGELLGGSQ